MKVPAQLIVSVVAFVALPHFAAAQAPPASQAPAAREATIQQITVRGTVEAIDQTARTVRVRGEQGNIVTLDVPTSATRFKEVKVGDVISMTYYDRVNIRPKPTGEPDVDQTLPATTTSTPGLLPSGVRTTQRTTTVTLDSWDPVTRMLTFRTPGGQSYTRRVNETLDASLLAGLKVGDRVDVTRTDALSLQVEQVAAPAAAPAQGVGAAVLSTFRNRSTISFLWGPDNGFSGTALKDGNGLVNGTTPIDFNDTSFDDIYGRIDLFKLGFGWRTNPRVEANFNLAFGRSAADTVTVGTIGTANAPLSVRFDDYWYWGVEGGQRFYFTRVRLTPFVGYVVGINHIKQIDGHFTSPAVGLQPALDVADGPVFDDSWAFNFGPTTGVLVGLGPVEIQAELAIRYMGGLSDVGFLPNSNLTEINTDTSRWSLPFLIGARLRF